MILYLRKVNNYIKFYSYITNDINYNTNINYINDDKSINNILLYKSNKSQYKSSDEILKEQNLKITK